MLFKKDTNYTKYMVLSKPRSGSSMVANMIRKHRNVYAAGELFDRLNSRTPKAIWDSNFRPMRKTIKAVGFKLHYNHPADSTTRETWDFLCEQQDLHIIHLKRNNILRSLVSGKISRKLKKFHLMFEFNRPSPEVRRIVITPGELIHVIKKTREAYEYHTALFSHHPMIHVEYEKVVNDPNGEYKKISDFLELPESSTKINSVIMNPEPLSELIENYEDLHRQFCSSEHAWMFTPADAAD